jgi:serine/threonine protein kinase
VYARSVQVVSGTVLAGRYRLDSLLGRGGMGAVHRGTDLQSGASVAVKLIQRDDPQLVSRFRREGALMTRLQHPHIVQVLEAGEIDGTLFIAMELVEGETLAHRLDRGDALPVDEALEIVRSVALALAAAHEAGILHRDVKPANIMLSRRPDDTPRAVLLDFGIARSPEVDATMTSTGLVVGTAGYIAPEIGMGSRQWEARADLYSLGVVLYEALAGAPPFVAGNAMALMARQATEDPIPPHVREPTVPEAASSLALRLMARDPHRRPPHAAAVVDAIDALLAGQAHGHIITTEGAAVEEHSPLFDITTDQVARVVRLTRTAVPYQRAEDAGAAYGAMRAAWPMERRGDFALLIDSRAAPMRLDPRFSKIVAAELPELVRGWRRVATLILTDEGREQIVALRQRVGVDPRGVFQDEDAALAWLLGED